jgi:shikimate kinase
MGGSIELDGGVMTTEAREYGNLDQKNHGKSNKKDYGIMIPEDCGNKVAKDCENIILTGMPGSGKSTVGPLLAEKTGRSFVDTDDIIREADGRKPGDIVRGEGHARFLELQQQIITSMDFRDSVIATGGGAVKSDGLMQYFKRTGTVIFLDEDPSTLEGRLAPGRRLARAEGQTFMDVFEERRPLYIKYADHIINCSGKTADEIAMEIINTLEKMYDE